MFKLGTVICSTYDKTIRGPIVGYGVVEWPDREAVKNEDGPVAVYLVQTWEGSAHDKVACRVLRQSYAVLAADVDHWTWTSGGVPEFSPKR